MFFPPNNLIQTLKIRFLELDFLGTLEDALSYLLKENSYLQVAE